MAAPDFDVLVIGAGMSGINTGYRLQAETPDLTYAILEARDAIGGTWDLFKYPGLRSDSDLHTFGFSWRPWYEPQAIAGGKKIVAYVRECAAIEGIDKHIQFKSKVVEANWISAQKRWSLTVNGPGEQTRVLTATYAIFGTGYYDYDRPMESRIPGIENFKGTVIHPQFWPEDLDYKNKEVAIIGSGATAITMVPVMCKTAKHVTMVQRSPTYILNRPSIDPLGAFVHKWLPKWLAFKIVRIKFLLVPLIFFRFCVAFPAAARRILAFTTKKELAKGVPLDPHFMPSYNPWEQRLCICPDADFYKALNSGKASIVTGHIENVKEDSIVMQGPYTEKAEPGANGATHVKPLKGGRGEVLHPDIIITATGLRIMIVGGAAIKIDGKQVDLAEKFLWKGFMVQDIPNAVVVLGYTNASWTLGADATGLFFTRLIKHMKAKNLNVVVPYLESRGNMGVVSPFNLTSTYVEKALKDIPMAGTAGPWRPRENYMSDLWTAKYGSLANGLVYSK